MQHRHFLKKIKTKTELRIRTRSGSEVHCGAAGFDSQCYNNKNKEKTFKIRFLSSVAFHGPWIEALVHIIQVFKTLNPEKMSVRSSQRMVITSKRLLQQNKVQYEQYVGRAHLTSLLRQNFTIKSRAKLTSLLGQNFRIKGG